MSGFDCEQCGAHIKAERRCDKPCRAPDRRDLLSSRFDADRERCYRLDLEESVDAARWMARYPDYKRRGLTWEEEGRYPLRELDAMRCVDSAVSAYERERIASSKERGNRSSSSTGQRGYPTVAPPWGKGVK